MTFSICEFPVRAGLLRFALICILMCGLQNVASAGGPGTASGEFLVIYADARPTALGGAYTSLSDNAAGLGYNAAGLVRPDRKELTASHIQWIAQSSFQHISLTYPMGGGKDAWGVSLLYFNAGNFTLTDQLGLPTTTTLRANDIAATFGYGRKYSDQLSLGAAGKFIRRTLDRSTANAFAIDLGAQFKPFHQDLTIGLAVQNIGTKLTFTQDEESLPFTVRAGISAPLFLESLVVTADVIKVVDESVKFAAGTEYEVFKGLKLRAGYQNNEGLMESITAGFGVTFKNITLDYAYVPFEVFGATHRVTGTLAFGEPKNPTILEAPKTPFPDRRPTRETEPASDPTPERTRTPQPIRRKIESDKEIRIIGAEEGPTRR